MPKSKKKTNNVSVNSESEEEEDDVNATQTLTMTQAEKAASNYSRNDINRRVNDLVQYLLVMDQKKIPIKKADINKIILKEMRKLFPTLIEEAREKLRNVFGIELVEVGEKTKAYLLISNIDHDTDKPHLDWPDEDNQKLALVMITLSLIFMNNNTMNDSQLWHALKKLDIEPNKKHPVFGDVKKLLTQEFVRQGYLEYTRLANTDPPVYEFTWGVRAKAETSKRDVLDFVCQVYENVNPEQWTGQYQDMLRTDGPVEADMEAA